MATKSIGLTGRDYSTLAAYSSYLNALALTAPEVAEFYKDSGPVADTAAVILSGYTGASSTNTITLRPASGQGFKDDAGAATNAVKWNSAVGAALTNSVAYQGANGAYQFTGGYIIVDGLQIKSTGANSRNLKFSGTDIIVKNSILHATSTGAAAISTGGTGRKIQNCAIISSGTGNGLDVEGNGVTLAVENCTIAKLGSASGTGVASAYTTIVLMKNTAIINFNFDTSVASSGTFSASCANNATSRTAFDITNAGAGTPRTSIAAGTDITSITSGSENLRIVSTSTKLVDTGVTTGLTSDMFGVARGATYDIGSTEYVAAADTTAPTLTSPTGTQTGSTTASGTVSTDEANGTLYYLASTNATETAATVKAASSQAVSATGSQAVSFTGLTASTTYYAHFCHRDAAGNDSTVANSASFTTASSAQTLTPSLFTNSNTFYSPTVAPGDVALTPSLFTNSNTFYSATVTLAGGDQSLTPDLFSNSNAFYAATVARVPGFLTPVLKNNTGTVLASETGVACNVYNSTTGALVVRKTGLTSSAAGIVSVTDAAMAAGTTYAYEIVLTGARRLPVAAA